MASAMSIPVETPADVQIFPCTTKSACASTDTSGKRVARSSQLAQCVATRAFFNSPNSARSNAPEHTEPKRSHVRVQRAIHRRVVDSVATRSRASALPPEIKSVSTVRALIRDSARVCTDTPQLLLTKPPAGETTSTL